jgi:Uma2 family endonuclease
MTAILSKQTAIRRPRTHKELPESDGAMVENFLEHPQSILLTETIWPVLQQRHPDGQFCVGQNSGIYWRDMDPPLHGCKAPDWFYVPGVPAMLEGEYRRSYVLWREVVAPLVIVEFVSGDGAEERDRTFHTGKFWVYEQAIRAPFYAIYEVDPGGVEVYHLVDGRYELVTANERGHYPIAPLGVELGIWQGRFLNQEVPWLRWWDAQGQLLPMPSERAEAAEQRALRLAERLRAAGIDPDKE